MTDPVLDAHRQAQFYYLISGPSPISIRDQILRGITLVERLLECQEIGPNRPLLVIGAGAAGASAAIESASQGVRTVLLEAQLTPFLTQRHATSRWIDPTQYDWPLDHYHHAQLPWSGAHRPLPLSFSAAYAHVLASRWHVELARAASVLGLLLDLRFGRSVARPPTLIAQPAGPFPTSLGVTLDDGSTAVVGAVIVAKGFGSENCRFERPSGNLVYEGQPFWGPDNFPSRAVGVNNVLISGSGDGALQDYMRVITGLPSAISIARRCNIPLSAMQAVQSAEDRSLRGRSWASEDRSFRHGHEAPYFAELEGVPPRHGRPLLEKSLCKVWAACPPPTAPRGRDCRISRALHL